MDLGVTGLRVVVSGGTQGIGRAIVEVLATQGAAVAFRARTKGDAGVTQAEIERKGGQVLGHGIEIELMGCGRMVEAALPHLEVSRVASIVSISNVSGREIGVAAGPYGAFKAVLVHDTQGLAYQLAGKDIVDGALTRGVQS